MAWLSLLALLTIFTLMDTASTALGTTIGITELNPVVTGLGIPTWTILRTALLTLMLTTFSAGHELCLRHFPRGTRIFEATLLFLNTYIGTIAFLGLVAILENTL